MSAYSVPANVLEEVITLSDTNPKRIKATKTLALSFIILPSPTNAGNFKGGFATPAPLRDLPQSFGPYVLAGGVALTFDLNQFYVQSDNAADTFILQAVLAPDLA